MSKVYFKLSKKAFAASAILDLTPNKLYEFTPIPKVSGLGYIIDDSNYNLLIDIDVITCLHLNQLTGWIKHRPKSNKPKKV